MTAIRLFALASALTLTVPGSARAQDWMEYTNKADRFSVAFPGEPAVETTTYKTEYTAVVPSRIYKATAGRQRYSLQVVDYTDIEQIHKERVKSCPKDAHSECAGSEGPIGIGSWKFDVLAALDNATARFLKGEGKITHFTWLVIDRVQGRQIHLTLPDGSREFVALHMHEGRVYILDAVVGPGEPEPGLFQQSLQFLDDNGDVIRYYDVYRVGHPPPSRTR
jgi:hypothetical protein